MTKEELREHCEKQVKACEMWAENRGQEPSGKIYEEHKLILDLIKALEQQPCEDCENNDGECCRLLFEKSFNKSEIPTSDDCVSRQAVLDNAYAYGNGLEPEGYCVNVEDIQALPPVTPTHGTCKDCENWDKDIKQCDNMCWCKVHKGFYSANYFCGDFAKRGNEK